MPSLHRALRVHFRFNAGADNWPILATPRSGRDRGRVDLAKTMADLGFTKGLEIGTRYGASAKLWCETLPGLDLTCVDPWRAYNRVRQEKQDAIYAGAVKNLAPYSCTIIREASRDVVGQFADESFDFVNIDGDHTYDECVQDIIQYVPKVRFGGLVLVHDYCAFRRSGVMQAVDGYTHCHRIDPWYVTRDHEPTAFWQRGAENA